MRTSFAADEQRRGGRVPQPVDVVVDGRVLLDVEVGLRDVGLGLVVVVVGDEVLDRVLRQELAELVAELRGERLVVGDHERRLLHLLDDPRHRRRLPGPGGAEQRLVAVAAARSTRRARRSPRAGRRSAGRPRRRGSGHRAIVAARRWRGLHPPRAAKGPEHARGGSAGPARRFGGSRASPRGGRASSLVPGHRRPARRDDVALLLPLRSSRGRRPAAKELHFFDDNYWRGVDWYRSFFPTARRPSACAAATSWEKRRRTTSSTRPSQRGWRRPSPTSGSSRSCATRSTARTPTTRRCGRMGFERLSFEKALAAEERRLAGEEERLLADPRYRQRSTIAAMPTSARASTPTSSSAGSASFPRTSSSCSSPRTSSRDRPRSTRRRSTSSASLWQPEALEDRNPASYKPLAPELRARRLESASPSRTRAWPASSAGTCGRA